MSADVATHVETLRRALAEVGASLAAILAVAAAEPRAATNAPPVSIADAARRLGIAPVTLARLARRAVDAAPAIRAGRSVRFDLAALEEWSRRQPRVVARRRRAPIKLVESGSPTIDLVGTGLRAKGRH